MVARATCAERVVRGRFPTVAPLAVALGAVLELESHLRGQAVGLLATYLRRDEDLEAVPLLK
jgi:hypothetical protein